MCRIVQYDYTSCGHQSAPSIQRCQQAVELNNAMCPDASEEGLPEIVIPFERFCPSCSQAQSRDLEEPTLHHRQAEASSDARTQADYGHLQGDEEELDRLALQTALEASKLDVKEEDFREVMEATEVEAEEYERRMVEEVLRTSFEEMPGMGTKRKIDSMASSAISDMKSLPQGGERTLRSMTDRNTISSGGTAVPAAQNILRGPRDPPSPPRSPMEAAGDLEREEELRRAKYERMKSGPEPEGTESVIGGDRMPGFEDLPRGDAQPSVVSDSVNEDEENDGSESGETETIRRLESGSGGRYSGYATKH
ncbi:hypothetical protein KC327_g16893 [Hortaea werneckii]|nr:hypothetical protein KC327_g16893 [Hortaea werneckii]KAI7253546.1 hypothetical protein KC335_g14996 [Hortaea werneckii]